MKKNIENSVRKKKALGIITDLLCILAVVIAAVLVRSTPAALYGESEEAREAFTDENGVLYLTDIDSYYHVRLVDNFLNGGSLGDSVSEDGRPWDTRSYYPEGRSAEYQPGIVWLTAGIWRLFGGSLPALEYRIPAFVAALSAAAAWLIGRRIGRRAGGAAAGLLVACAPIFAVRTCYGRFDTDMFVVVMEVLLILFVTEALRAKSWKGRIAAGAGFTLSAAVYALCWTPTFSMLFAGLTLFGGLLFCLFGPLFIKTDSRPAAARVFKNPGLWTLAGMGVLTILALLIAVGPSAFPRILAGLSFSTDSGSSSLPNLLASVSELSKAGFLPEQFWQSFLGYVTEDIPPVVNSVGGLVCFVLAVIGLFWLVLTAFTSLRGKKEYLSRQESALYFFVLAAWFFAGLFLIERGIRFAEHLVIPVGILAGGFIGRLFVQFIPEQDTAAAQITEEEKPEKKKARYALILIPILIFAAAAVPAVSGSALAAADSRPTVTDATANAMRYIKENAQDPDAVLSSWWDMGYYYESESGHPCLWDGGTQNGARAILVSKALTSDDMELSRRILFMLSASGNKGIDLLMEHMDAELAFQALWRVLLLKKDSAMRLLQETCGLDTKTAEEAWTLIRPEEQKETYLLIHSDMTWQMGWFEYYAGWDFTGKQPLPVKTVYDFSPDGAQLFTTEEGREYKENVRGKETMWRLFFDAEPTPCFTPVFEWHDGLDHIRIWKVEPEQ